MFVKRAVAAHTSCQKTIVPVITPLENLLL